MRLASSASRKVHQDYCRPAICHLPVKAWLCVVFFILLPGCSGSGKDAANLQSVIRAKDNTIAKQKQEIEDLGKQIASLNRKAENLSLSTPRTDEPTRPAPSITPTLPDTVPADQDIEKLKKERAGLEKQVTELKKEIFEGNLKRQSLEVSLTDLRNQVAERDRLVAELRAKVKPAQGGSSSVAETAQLKQQIDSLNKQVAENKVTITSLNARISEYNNQLVSLNRSVVQKDTLIQQLTTTTTDLALKVEEYYARSVTYSRAIADTRSLVTKGDKHTYQYGAVYLDGRTYWWVFDKMARITDSAAMKNYLSRERWQYVDHYQSGQRRVFLYRRSTGSG